MGIPLHTCVAVCSMCVHVVVGRCAMLSVCMCTCHFHFLYMATDEDNCIVIETLVQMTLRLLWL